MRGDQVALRGEGGSQMGLETRLVVSDHGNYHGGDCLKLVILRLVVRHYFIF